MSGKRYIACVVDGEVSVHAPACEGNYATLCGISIDDEEVNGRECALPIGARIDCKVCIAIIRGAKKYRERDFAKAAP